MKKKLCISVLILVGALVLAGAALAADPKAVEAQTKEPAAGAARCEPRRPLRPRPRNRRRADPGPGGQGRRGRDQTVPPSPAVPQTPKADQAAVAGQSRPKARPRRPDQAAAAVAAKGYNGKVVDAQTKAPIAGALVTLGDQQVRADKDGVFHLEGAGETLKLRYPGYARRELPTSELTGPTTEIALTPFKVKALYLSSYGLASKKIREAAKEAIKLNNMNALVIDVKGDQRLYPL